MRFCKQVVPYTYYTLREEILVRIDTVTAGVKFVSMTSCTRRVDETCECEKVTSSTTDDWRIGSSQIWWNSACHSPLRSIRVKGWGLLKIGQATSINRYNSAKRSNLSCERLTRLLVNSGRVDGACGQVPWTLIDDCHERLYAHLNCALSTVRR